MDMRIALAGNPNCGKTTLFNALTGSNQFVGNWPGVTVEKKEGKLKTNKDVIKKNHIKLTITYVHICTYMYIDILLYMCCELGF